MATESLKQPLIAAPLLTRDAETLDRFIATGDLRLLENGIAFEKSETYVTLMMVTAQVANVLLGCLPTFLCPLGVWRPASFYDKFDLKLTSDAILFNTASNDCCFHIATSQKTVPLDKIQDVELNTSCCLTMFGLKSIDIQTAGQSGPEQGAEVSARFVADPVKAREAIRLALKKIREQSVAPPSAQLMSTTGSAPHLLPGGTQPPPSADDSLRSRLSHLAQLVKRGVLSGEDAEAIRMSVLCAEADPTARLLEAAALTEEGLITADELAILASHVVGANRSLNR